MFFIKLPLAPKAAHQAIDRKNVLFKFNDVGFVIKIN